MSQTLHILVTPVRINKTLGPPLIWSVKLHLEFHVCYEGPLFIYISIFILVSLYLFQSLYFSVHINSFIYISLSFISVKHWRRIWWVWESKAKCYCIETQLELYLNEPRVDAKTKLDILSFCRVNLFHYPEIAASFIFQRLLIWQAHIIHSCVNCNIWVNFQP